MRYARTREYRFYPRQAIELLDAVVARLTQSRFTVTEEDVLPSIWAAGEDVRLREDPRFFELEEAGHFHLAAHTLANERLIDRLWQGLWDGTDLNAELARLDDLHPNCFHVFCAKDPRLLLEDGTYVLAARPKVQLPEAWQTQLDALAAQLLAVHCTLAVPATTLQLWDEVLRLNSAIDSAEQHVDWFAAWLHHRSEWIEMSRGLWLPMELVPKFEPPQMYRVWQIHQEHAASVLPISPINQDSTPTENTEKGLDSSPAPPIERHLDASISWTHPLRTIHLNNGYIPIPVTARFRYPKVAGQQPLVAIRGLIQATGHEGWLWLDREQHCFFGDFLRETVEWEEAGRRLHLHWQPEALVIRFGDVDETIHEEEARHLDPQALQGLRMGRGESYRQSLVAILSVSPEGMSFQALYQTLMQRQQHTPSRSSIRTILAQVPEFDWRDGAWHWQEFATAAQALRRCLLGGEIAATSSEKKTALKNLSDMTTLRVSEILANLSK